MPEKPKSKQNSERKIASSKEETPIHSNSDQSELGKNNGQNQDFSISSNAKSVILDRKIIQKPSINVPKEEELNGRNSPEIPVVKEIKKNKNLKVAQKEEIRKSKSKDNLVDGRDNLVSNVEAQVEKGNEITKGKDDTEKIENHETLPKEVVETKEMVSHTKPRSAKSVKPSENDIVGKKTKPKVEDKAEIKKEKKNKVESKSHVEEKEPVIVDTTNPGNNSVEVDSKEESIEIDITEQQSEHGPSNESSNDIEIEQNECETHVETSDESRELNDEISNEDVGDVNEEVHDQNVETKRKHSRDKLIITKERSTIQNQKPVKHRYFKNKVVDSPKKAYQKKTAHESWLKEQHNHSVEEFDHVTKIVTKGLHGNELDENEQKIYDEYLLQIAEIERRQKEIEHREKERKRIREMRVKMAEYAEAEEKLMGKAEDFSRQREHREATRARIKARAEKNKGLRKKVKNIDVKEVSQRLKDNSNHKKYEEMDKRIESAENRRLQEVAQKRKEYVHLDVNELLEFEKNAIQHEIMAKKEAHAKVQRVFEERKSDMSFDKSHAYEVAVNKETATRERINKQRQDAIRKKQKIKAYQAQTKQLHQNLPRKKASDDHEMTLPNICNNSSTVSLPYNDDKFPESAPTTVRSNEAEHHKFIPKSILESILLKQNPGVSVENSLVTVDGDVGMGQEDSISGNNGIPGDMVDSVGLDDEPDFGFDGVEEKEEINDFTQFVPDVTPEQFPEKLDIKVNRSSVKYRKRIESSKSKKKTRKDQDEKETEDQIEDVDFIPEPDDANIEEKDVYLDTEAHDNELEHPNINEPDFEDRNENSESYVTDSVHVESSEPNFDSESLPTESINVSQSTQDVEVTDNLSKESRQSTRNSARSEKLEKINSRNSNRVKSRESTKENNIESRRGSAKAKQRVDSGNSRVNSSRKGNSRISTRNSARNEVGKPPRPESQEKNGPSHNSSDMDSIRSNNVDLINNDNDLQQNDVVEDNFKNSENVVEQEQNIQDSLKKTSLETEAYLDDQAEVVEKLAIDTKDVVDAGEIHLQDIKNFVDQIQEEN
eukprot:TRINITY_DN3320_c1_g5_i1.p1 TRINITY_DN3320_c1_g5~~TRINITY_DN3320_c1_g5_i1.p1  ORF type:complete len:1058 (+),score=379.46 TRINITY_DN3320_c1_g5_i1:42-3215(+)